MKAIQKYIKNRKEEYRKVAIDNIRSDFKIKERNGVLFLAHHDVAFRRIDSNAKADDITKMLNEARDAAIIFEGL